MVIAFELIIIYLLSVIAIYIILTGIIGIVTMSFINLKMKKINYNMILGIKASVRHRDLICIMVIQLLINYGMEY